MTNFHKFLRRNHWKCLDFIRTTIAASIVFNWMQGVCRAHVFLRISKQLLPFIMELRGENMLETQLYCYQRCYDLFITEIWRIFCCHVTKFKSHSILKGFPAWVSLAVSHKRAWLHGNATQANLPASQSAPPPSLFPGCYWACLVFVYWVKADWIHLSKQLKVCS